MKIKLLIEVECEGLKCSKCAHSLHEMCFKFRDKGNLPEPCKNNMRCGQCLDAEKEFNNHKQLINQLHKAIVNET